ncbi:hypothetical protein Ancab_024852 [Ancistrocladus abbreviatus]
MEKNPWRLFASMAAAVILLFFLDLPLIGSSSVYILESQLSAGPGRKLLQAQKSCPVNFEFANYTALVSKCKGPRYPASVCCAAFKEFACPYAEQINDLSNDCATTLFSYINIYGRYPPGLFASECKEGKQGLECPATSPAQSADVNGTPITCDKPLLLMLSASILTTLLQLL